MAEDKVIVKFPTWNMVTSLNDASEYRGLTCRYHISKDLYVLIEVLNESVIKKDENDQLRFSFATGEGNSIASVRYNFCEEKYYIGLCQLMRWAEEFEEAFGYFRETSRLLMNNEKIEQ